MRCRNPLCEAVFAAAIVTEGLHNEVSVADQLTDGWGMTSVKSCSRVRVARYGGASVVSCTAPTERPGAV